MLKFLLLLPLIICPEFTDPEEINIMTFNIRNGTIDNGINSWDNRREMVFEMLGKYENDFVGLQEALGFQIDDILSALPVYEMTGRTRDISPYEGESCPILFNSEKWELLESDHFWLSEAPKTPGSISWGAALPRICTMGIFKNISSGFIITIYNTHLDHLSAQAREESVVLIARHILRKNIHRNLVVMGDFNSIEYDTPVTFLLNHSSLNLQDAFRAKHRRISPADATFYGWGEHNPEIGLRVDYLLTSRDLKIQNCNVVDFRVDDRYPSDHSPVVAELEIIR